MSRRGPSSGQAGQHGGSAAGVIGGPSNNSTTTSEKDANAIKTYYNLGRTLGIGTFCKVQLGTHKLTGLKCAIKIFNLAKLKEMGVLNKIQTELDVLSLLTPHDHIVKLYQVIYGPLNIYAVIEFLPNGDLFDYIVSQGKLPEEEARGMFQEIVSGVDYCHVNMVVHRDLKPENLLLDAHNHIKLADFGLSNVATDGMFLRTSCGSPNYAAPEVISADLYPGPEVDVWSCGVILYAMLCGRLPFDSDNIHNLYKSIKTGSFNLPYNLPPTARDLISRMIVTDPLKRITIADIRRHPWFSKTLPPGLSLSPWQQSQEARRIDSESIAQLVKFGYAESDIRTALHVKMLAKVQVTGTGRRRQLTVPSEEETRVAQLQGLYNLIHDNRRKRKEDIERLKMGPKDAPKPQVNQPSSSEQEPGIFVPGDPLPWEETITSPHSPSGGSDRSDSSLLGGILPAVGRLLNLTKDKDKEKERDKTGLLKMGTGLTFSGARAEDIMTCLYHCLKKYNFEWKVMSLYKVKARCPPASLLSHTKPRNIVKLIVTLYKAPRKDFREKEEKTSSRPSSRKGSLHAPAGGNNGSTGGDYILDFMHVYGRAFKFFDVCTSIAMDLRVPVENLPGSQSRSRLPSQQSVKSSDPPTNPV